MSICTDAILTMNSKQLTRQELEKLIKNQDESVTYVEKKKQPNSAHLWDYFHEVFVNKVRRNFVSCNLCKSLLAFISANGTKTMKTHLIACRKPSDDTENNNQKSIKEFYSSSSRTNVPKRMKSSLATACAEFAALDGRAFETMSGQGFLILANHLLNVGRVLEKMQIPRK